MNLRSLAALLALSTSPALAGSFQNLGFDLVDTSRLVPDPGPTLRGIGPAMDLLPGWQLARGTTPQTTLGLNVSLLTFGYSTLVSADQSGFFGFSVEGSHALQLVGAPANQEPFSLVQRGDVPIGAHLLSYRYSGFPFSVNINGVNMVPAIHTDTMEAFDISQFGGQTVDLQFQALGSLMPFGAGSSFIDSVAFTVPEPSTLALCIVGSLVFCCARKLRAPFP